MSRVWAWQRRCVPRSRCRGDVCPARSKCPAGMLPRYVRSCCRLGLWHHQVQISLHSCCRWSSRDQMPERVRGLKSQQGNHLDEGGLLAVRHELPGFLQERNSPTAIRGSRFFDRGQILKSLRPLRSWSGDPAVRGRMEASEESAERRPPPEPSFVLRGAAMPASVLLEAQCSVCFSAGIVSAASTSGLTRVERRARRGCALCGFLPAGNRPAARGRRPR